MFTKAALVVIFVGGLTSVAVAQDDFDWYQNHPIYLSVGVYHVAYLNPAFDAMHKHRAELMKIESAVGATVDVDEKGQPYILVMTKDTPTTATLNSAPTQLDGFPVEIEKMDGWSDPGATPTP
jgi:hypothetical protein